MVVIRPTPAPPLRIVTNGLTQAGKDLGAAGGSTLKAVDWFRVNVAGQQSFTAPPTTTLNKGQIAMLSLGIVAPEARLGVGGADVVAHAIPDLGGATGSTGAAIAAGDAAKVGTLADQLGKVAGDTANAVKSISKGVGSVGRSVVGVGKYVASSPLLKTGIGVAIGGTLVGQGVQNALTGLAQGVSTLTGGGAITQPPAVPGLGGLLNLLGGAGAGSAAPGTAQPSPTTPSGISLSPLDYIAIIAAIAVVGYVIVKKV